MAKQTKPTKSSTTKKDIGKKAAPEVNPKSQSRFNDDDEDDFDLPIEDLEGIDDLNYDDDDDDF